MAQNSDNNSDIRAQRLRNIEPHKWKKGKSDNPGGRPKKIISEFYEKLAKLKCPGDPQGRTYRELLAEGQFKQAIKGDTRARDNGSIRRQTRSGHFGPDGNPITIELLDRFLEEADQEDGEASQ